MMIDAEAAAVAPQHGIDPAAAAAMSKQILEGAAEKQLADAERRAKKRGEPGVVAIGGGKSRVKIPLADLRVAIGWLLGRVK